MNEICPTARTIRASMATILAVVLCVLLLSACATSAVPSAEMSPLEKAKLVYVTASIDYEATMLTLVDLRAAGRVTDQQWSRIDLAQDHVQNYTPAVRAALAAWEASGNKPADFDSLLGKLRFAAALVGGVLSEVNQ